MSLSTPSLWCERRGAFYDTLPGTDKQPRETSVTANAMAMIFGAPTPEQARAVIRHFDRNAANFDPLDEGRFNVGLRLVLRPGRLVRARRRSNGGTRHGARSSPR